MRLEHDDQPPLEPGAGGGDDRRDLGRVVAVVVDDQDAAGLAEQLEAALGAAELGQRRGDGLEAQPELEADGDGGERVQQVVAARHGQPQRAQLAAAATTHAAARSERFERDRRAAHVGRGASMP